MLLCGAVTEARLRGFSRLSLWTPRDHGRARAFTSAKPGAPPAARATVASWGSRQSSTRARSNEACDLGRFDTGAGRGPHALPRASSPAQFA